jgi:hypothetical protein
MNVILRLVRRNTILNNIIHILDHSLDFGHDVIEKSGAALVYLLDLIIALKHLLKVDLVNCQFLF